MSCEDFIHGDGRGWAMRHGRRRRMMPHRGQGGGPEKGARGRAAFAASVGKSGGRRFRWDRELVARRRAAELRQAVDEAWPWGGASYRQFAEHLGMEAEGHASTGEDMGQSEPEAARDTAGAWIRDVEWDQEHEASLRPRGKASWNAELALLADTDTASTSTGGSLGSEPDEHQRDYGVGAADLSQLSKECCSGRVAAGQGRRRAERWEAAMVRAAELFQSWLLARRAWPSRAGPTPGSRQKRRPPRRDKRVQGNLLTRVDGAFEKLRATFLHQHEATIRTSLSAVFEGEVELQPTPLAADVKERFTRACGRTGQIMPAFHGTKRSNHEPIFQRGLLVPGAASGVRVANGSAYGVGIYATQPHLIHVSRSYCSEPCMLVCGVVRDVQAAGMRDFGGLLVIDSEARVAPLFEATGEMWRASALPLGHLPPWSLAASRAARSTAPVTLRSTATRMVPGGGRVTVATVTVLGKGTITQTTTRAAQHLAEAGGAARFLARAAARRRRSRLVASPSQ